MAGFVAGLDRGQTTLPPECLEDWVDENKSVARYMSRLDTADRQTAAGKRPPTSVAAQRC